MYIKIKVMLDEILNDEKKIEQTEAVIFGTKEFIEIPESINNYRM